MGIKVLTGVLLACLFTTASLCAAADINGAVHCDVRLFNDLFGLEATLFNPAAASQKTTAGFQAVGSYAPFDIGAGGLKVSTPQRPTTTVRFPFQANQRYTVYAFRARDDTIHYVVTEDPQAQRAGLHIDTAIVRAVNLFSVISEPIDVYGVDSNCYKCTKDAIHIDLPLGNYSQYQVVPTAHPYDVAIEVGERFLNISVDLQEHGAYTFAVVASTGAQKLILVTDVEGNETWIPLIVAVSAIAFLGICYKLGKVVYVRCCTSQDRGEDDDLADVEGLASAAKTRVRSIDTFRGLALAIMIFVNYGGGGYWFFDHSRWNGLTVADLVFPWFVWISGTSLAISIDSQLRRSVPRKKIMMKAAIRAIKLYALGLFLNNGVDLSNW